MKIPMNIIGIANDDCGLEKIIDTPTKNHMPPQPSRDGIRYLCLCSELPKPNTTEETMKSIPHHTSGRIFDMMT
jgi:hypothetical protein